MPSNSLTGGGIIWLRRLWRRTADGVGPSSGPQPTLLAGPATAALESQLCEGFVERDAGGICAEQTRKMNLPGAPGDNLFGRPLQIERAHSAAEAVALLSGMTMAGLRSTSFVSGRELPAVHAGLRGCAERLLPLVLHAELGDSGHAGYHAVADAGAFQLMASSLQETLDLTLLARWIAERSLCPGLLASDGAQLESVALPDPKLVRSFLGAPGAALTSPGEGQRLLFGAERARLFAWFDADRPVATGGLRSLDAETRAAAGREAFFQSELCALAREGMQTLGQLTGRPLSFVSAHGMADAELVWLAQGAVAQTARATADELRRQGRARIGVLTIHWLRPWPAEQITAALGALRCPVAVIEALDPGAGEPPLLRELAATAAGSGWTSAICARNGPTPAALEWLCQLMGRADRSSRVNLEGAAAPDASSEFPRREALIQSVAHAYPSLSEAGPSAPQIAVTPSRDRRSLGLLAHEATLPASALERFTELAESELRGCLRGGVTRPEPGCLAVRLHAAAESFAGPGVRAAVSLLLVAGEPRSLGDALASVTEKGLALLASDAAPERVWSEAPVLWRRRVRDKGLRVLLVGSDFDQALEALRETLRGELEVLLSEGRASEIPWREMSGEDSPDRALPAVVERIERIRPTHDSLPRFWGEVEQPRQGGEVDSLPEPISTVAAVPAGASALAPSAQSDLLPQLDVQACTGCGRCWSACPDSAIGVTALSLEPLLTAASHQAGCQGQAANALRRAHKHLAGRLAGALRKSESATLDGALMRDAWDWLLGQLDPPEEQRPDYEAAFEATVEALSQLEPVVCKPFFDQPEAARKGAGALLVLAVDPRACLGCGLCAAVCPEQALPLVACEAEDRRAYAEHWRLWEALPDTPGEIIAQAAEHADVGRLAAVLLSRHCAQAQVASASGEPGSGERLATRLLAALLEERGQRRASETLGQLDERRIKLDQAVREQLAAGLSKTDLTTLEHALSESGRGPADLAQLGTRLEELGSRAEIDRANVLRMTHAAGELDDWSARLASGQDGLGRARFGAVITRGSLSDWAARFPLHPFYAPLTLAPSTEGIELARGLARGLVAQHLALVRSLRVAELELEQPPDRAQRLEAIQRLSWRDLEPGEQQACPPLLLLADDHALLDSGLGALTRLLEAELPIKLVLLDGIGRLARAGDAALLAMAHQGAFVLSTSIAHADHLAAGVTDALAHAGPALIHIHAPSPGRHGFAADAALERARLAVEARAHVLLRYDPAAEGSFGLRASLAGNPAPQQDWGEVDYLGWAAGEQRFDDHLTTREETHAALPLDAWLAQPESGRRGNLPGVEIGERALIASRELADAAATRLARWRTLQELTGGRSPFSERIRETLSAEIESEQSAKREALQASHAAELASLKASAEQDSRERLTQRLLELSGFDSPPETSGNGTS